MKTQYSLRTRVLCATLAVSMTGSSALVFLTGCEGLDYSARGEGTGVQIVGAIVVLAKYHASAHQKAVAEQKARTAVAQYVRPVYTERRAARQDSSRKRIVATTESFDKRIATAKAKAKSSSKTTKSSTVASTKPKTKPEVTPDAPAKPKTGKTGTTAKTTPTKTSAPEKPAPEVVKTTPRDTDVEDRAAQAAAEAEAARLEREKAEALAKLKAEAAAELNSLDSAWRSLGGVSDHSVESASGGPAESVPVASTRDKEALVASATAHVPNYIAVSVPAQGIAAEAGGRSNVMLWDTRRQQLASEDVLVLDRKPDEGKKLKVDGLTAQFVGNF